MLHMVVGGSQKARSDDVWIVATLATAASGGLFCYRC
jgi:hypothetical protein